MSDEGEEYNEILDDEETGTFASYCKEFCKFESIVNEWTQIQLSKWESIFVFMSKESRKDIMNLIYENLPEDYQVDMDEYNRFKGGRLNSYSKEDQEKMIAIRKTYDERYRIAERIFQSMRMLYGTKANEQYDKLQLKQNVSIL